MPAPKGNQFWKLAPTIGRKPKWTDPEELRSACEEYFEYVETNPLFDNHVISFQGCGTDHAVDKMRAMSIQGLCVFLGVARSTWNKYREDEVFSEVCEYVEMVMFEQKLTGAAAGLLNPSIIQRDLGLADKQDLDHKSAGKRIKTNWNIHPVTTKKENSVLKFKNN